MPDTDLDWTKWGRDDPYFGVLASPLFSRQNIAANRDAFFLSGQHFVSAMLGEMGRLSDNASRGRALDHGCGTGRLTIPLSRAYAKVVALDVSPEMLTEASSNARAANCHNIEFQLADDLLSRATGSFDLVVSHLVLQHVPVNRGNAIFRRLIDRLAPGAAFHISVSIRNDVGPLRALYWASAHLPLVKSVQNLLRGARWGAPAMQMNDYPLGNLIAELSKRGIQRLTIDVETYHESHP
jgi:SAM-dependent methyltransferase